MGVIVTARARQGRHTQELRAGIARDLHDDIGSNLSSIRLLSDLALQAAPDAFLRCGRSWRKSGAWRAGKRPTRCTILSGLSAPDERRWAIFPPGSAKRRGFC